MRGTRLLNDPLYELIAKRRNAKLLDARGQPIQARPEGVAIYRCQGHVEVAAAGETYEAITAPIGCGKRTEAKPYVAKPQCHGSVMAIVGYDWDRDVDA